MRTYKIIYTIFIAFILLDLTTTILCFQMNGLVETNLIYQMVGMWAFPIVYLTDAGILIMVEWLRKYLRWSPLILLIPIIAYTMATLTNLMNIFSFS